MATALGALSENGPKTLPPFENGDTDHNPPELRVYPVSCFQTKPNIIRRAG